MPSRPGCREVLVRGPAGAAMPPHSLPDAVHLLEDVGEDVHVIVGRAFVRKLCARDDRRVRHRGVFAEVERLDVDEVAGDAGDVLTRHHRLEHRLTGGVSRGAARPPFPRVEVRRVVRGVRMQLLQ